LANEPIQLHAAIEGYRDVATRATASVGRTSDMAHLGVGERRQGEHKEEEEMKHATPQKQSRR
jgi:hypothetical protein